jgi:hypothetical protein
MISRRQVLAAMAGATALGPAWAFAAQECVDAGEWARQCSVGIDIAVETARQRCNSWCWAACIQTIFAIHNHDVAQESLVEKLFGSADPEANCEGANEPSIVAAINGRWVDAYGFEFAASAEALPLSVTAVSTSQVDPNQTDPAAAAANMTINIFSGDDVRVVVNELANNNPLILGRTGGGTAHAVVVTGISYVEHSSGWIEITELVVRNPWPESVALRRLSGDEILNTFILIKVAVQG